MHWKVLCLSDVIRDCLVSGATDELLDCADWDTMDDARGLFVDMSTSSSLLLATSARMTGIACSTGPGITGPIEEA